MNIELLKNLIELNADEWNSALSLQLNIPIDTMRSTFNMRQSLSMTENKMKLNIDNSMLQKIAEDSVKEYENKINWADEDPDIKFKFIPPQDRFVNKLSDENEYHVNSFSCVGKIILGIDFTKCGFSDSFFNGCLFFNCVFNSAEFDDSVFLNCTFNMCDMSRSNCTGAQFSKCKFIDSAFDSTVMDKCVVGDSIFIACQMINAEFVYSTISYSGFNECTAHQSNFRNSKISVSSFISCNFSDANFRNSKLMDIAFLRDDFSGADLLGVKYISITAQEITYDGDYEEVFEMSRDSFCPALREWPSDELYDEDTVDDFMSDFSSGIDLDDDDDDDDDDDFRFGNDDGEGSLF